MHQTEDAADHSQGHVEDDLSLSIGIAVRIKHQPPGGEGQGQGRRQHGGHAHMTQNLGVAELAPARAQPPDSAQKAASGQDQRGVDAEPGGREMREGVGGGQRIAGQYKVEQRNLLGEGVELRPHQLPVIGRNPKQGDDRVELKSACRPGCNPDLSLWPRLLRRRKNQSSGSAYIIGLGREILSPDGAPIWRLPQAARRKAPVCARPGDSPACAPEPPSSPRFPCRRTRPPGRS